MYYYVETQSHRIVLRNEIESTTPRTRAIIAILDTIETTGAAAPVKDMVAETIEFSNSGT